MIEIQDYPIYTPIPSGCKLLGTDETGATKNFSIQDVMKTLKSSDYTDNPLGTAIPNGCKVIGANASGDTKNFYIQDVMKTLKSSDYTDNPLGTAIPNGCKVIGANASGDTKNFYIQDVVKTLKVSDYSSASSISPNDKFLGEDNTGQTQSYLFSDISSRVNTKGVRILSSNTTISLVDVNNIMYFPLSMGATLFIPTNATASISVGSQVTIIKTSSAATLTITPNAGVTVIGTLTPVTAQVYIVLTKVDVDTWVYSQLS